MKKNTIQKEYFNQSNLGYSPQFIVEVRELGEFEGQPCVYILMRELFYSKGRFRAMLPFLLAEWGIRLEIKKRIGGKYISISQMEAKAI